MVICRFICIFSEAGPELDTPDIMSELDMMFDGEAFCHWSWHLRYTLSAGR